MYSNEAKGERFPPVQGPATYFTDNIPGNVPGANCNSQDEPEFVPRNVAIYPEYISDWSVFQCPSNPDVGDGVESHLSIIAEGCPYAGQSDDHDDSYLYLGWVVDGADSDDPRTPYSGGELPTQLLLTLGTLQALGVDDRNEFAAQDAEAILSQLDGDFTLAAPFGNAEGDTVYRLREGIERFLITDINNPAASAKAQSDTAVFWDSINTDPGAGASYNHVPGGGNVLFMDGHVEFFRYQGAGQGEFPINGAFAETVRLVAP